MWDLAAAKTYVQAFVVDNEDYAEVGADRQTTLLNVASRTLKAKFDRYTIPNEAVYHFAAVLAVAYNDTNKLGNQGIASMSVKGVSFSFKDWSRQEMTQLIPDEVFQLIGEANGVKLKRRQIGRSVR